MIKIEEESLNNEILKIYNEYINKNPKLFEDSKQKNIVIFLGNTGSGKSTLINFLCGKKMEVIDPFKTPLGIYGGKIIEVEDCNEDNDQKPLKIGNSLESETLIPEFLTLTNKFSTNLNNSNSNNQYNNQFYPNDIQEEILFYDFAGFGDTRGLAQNLIKAYFIKNIIENSKHLKIVFVCSIHEIISERGRSFKELIEIVKNIFSLEELEKSSCLVFTKCMSKEEANQIQIIDFLKKNSLGFYYENNLISSFSIPYNCCFDEREKCEILDMTMLKLIYIKKKNIEISRIFKEKEINKLESICRKEFENLIEEISNKSNDGLEYYYSLKGYPKLQESFDKYFSLDPKQMFNLESLFKEQIKEKRIFQILSSIIWNIFESLNQNFAKDKIEKEVFKLTKKFSDYKVIKLKEVYDLNVYRKVGASYGADCKGAFIDDSKFVKNGEPITAWEINHHGAIDSIRFKYGTVWGNKHGGSGGTRAYVELNKGENIIAAFASSGQALYAIHFFTNQGRKFYYGKGGGMYKNETINFVKCLGYITSYYGNWYLFTFDNLVSSLNFYEAPFHDY